MIRPLQRPVLGCLCGLLILAAGNSCGTDLDDTGHAVQGASSELPTERAPGYLLISPLKDNSTYILADNGRVWHQWESDQPPGNSVYLLDDGDLLRCVREGDNPVFHGGGEGGRLQRMSWDGELEWDFLWSDETRLAHHDVAPLPNGNVLLLSWSRKTRAEALAAGMDPALIQGDEIWPDSVVEIKPIEPDGGEVVWTWNVWDHLVQEFDPAQANYGVVEDHPERIDLNAHRHREQKTEDEQKDELARMAALGYAGDTQPVVRAEEAPEAPAVVESPAATETEPKTEGKRRGGRGEDFCHTNGIDYNPQLDQIVLSVRTFSELWVIDHALTTEEAAGHTGGRYGKGGDLLYRWGNPINYGRGTQDHQQLFVQHDARWVPAGMPGAGNLTVFNNGSGRPDGDYSSVVEITPPISAEGGYMMKAGEPFGPHSPTWEYRAPDPTSFYSSFISGAERQPNGNTLICQGADGFVFEVNSAGSVVWEFTNPFGESDEQGEDRGPRPEPPGERGPRPGMRPRGPQGMGPPPGQGRRPGPPPGDGPPPHPDGGPHPADRPHPAGAPTDGAGEGRPEGKKRGMNSKALFRATRIAPEHPALNRKP